MLSFGGAYSNHIAALAEACKLTNLKSIGIIRGDELGQNLEKTLSENQTLKRAHSNGMQLHFVSRADYRKKELLPLVKRLLESENALLIPEGGTNQLAIMGCQEILTKADDDFDVIACSLGTSGTFSGLVEASNSKQYLIGLPALKGDFFHNEIKKYTSKSNWSLANYHFGGYAKYSPELINFINHFKRTYGISLDPIYTGKMMYGLLELVKSGHFSKNTRILAIHTGGLQSIEGFNKRLVTKKQPQLI